MPTRQRGIRCVWAGVERYATKDSDINRDDKQIASGNGSQDYLTTRIIVRPLPNTETREVHRSTLNQIPHWLDVNRGCAFDAASRLMHLRLSHHWDSESQPRDDGGEVSVPAARAPFCRCCANRAKDTVSSRCRCGAAA